jgi:hypothetical protein
MKRLRATGIILSWTLWASWASWAAPVERGGHFYEYVEAQGMSWDAARVAAQGRSHLGLRGHLATLTSFEENQIVASLIDGVVSYPGDPSAAAALEAWVGAYQDPVDELDAVAGWKWIDGEGSVPLSGASGGFANWYNGEPNDWLGAGTEQYLAVWGKDGYGNTIGSWNDEGGLWNITGYIVEYERFTLSDLGWTVRLAGVTWISLFGLRRKFARVLR